MMCYFVLVTLLTTLTLIPAQQSTVQGPTQYGGNTTGTHGSSKNCEVNGVTLHNRSMKYYGEYSYVACSHGIAACYRMTPAQDEAKEVVCPTQNFQERIDEETAYRDNEKKSKQKVERADEVGLRRL